MAAALAGGRGATLSHRSAAALWRMRPSARGRIDVTVTRGLRSRPGIQVHHSSLAGDEATVECGIAVTTPPRTLLDLAGVVSRRGVERAMEQAEVLRLTDALSLADLALRYPRRRGAGAINAILAARRIAATITRSELEERFLAFLDNADLPCPEVNVPLRLSGRWIEVDCMWRASSVVVELDGRASHATSSAFERDRTRDRILQAAGWRVVRITWRQLHEQPNAVAGDLMKLLARVPGCT